MGAYIICKTDSEKERVKHQTWGGNQTIRREGTRTMLEAEPMNMMACIRKLALWYTRTFRPLMTHDDLDPIMLTLGFVPAPTPTPPLGAIPWKEYLYSAGAHSEDSPPPPRPRLPYPRIDGLHVCTYRAFLNGVNFYLKMFNISDLFHVRGMPLHYLHDRSKKWSHIEEGGSNFVYREGTLDETQHENDCYWSDENDMNICNSELCNAIIRSRGKDAPTCTIVPLKDIIVLEHTV